MAGQEIAEFVPRVRRALEGPVPLTSGGLSDGQIVALTADAIADVILFTSGQWNHKLVATHRDEDTNVPDEWEVDPGLELEEESMVAAQAALTYYFHVFKDMKVSERTRNEGQEWEYALSANVVRDQIAALKEQRDRAIEALLANHPVLARYASFLEVRDRVASVYLEPWVRGGLGGGIELVP